MILIWLMTRVTHWVIWNSNITFLLYNFISTKSIISMFCIVLILWWLKILTVALYIICNYIKINRDNNIFVYLSFLLHTRQKYTTENQNIRIILTKTDLTITKLLPSTMLAKAKLFTFSALATIWIAKSCLSKNDKT